MNRERIVGNWMQVSGFIQEQWSTLQHDQDGVIAARCRKISGKAHTLNGIAQEYSASQLKEFFTRNRKWYISN